MNMDFKLFNWFGNGDLLITHEFVKEIMEAFPDSRVTFAHAKSPRMFADIPELEYSKLGDEYDNSKYTYQIGDTFYINTWIGLNGKYVSPANSNTVTNVKRLFNDHFTGKHVFSKPDIEYLPDVNYSYFEIDDVNKFMDYARENIKKPLVLLSTGSVQSNQAENFDWTYPIGMLCDTFKDSLFFIMTDPVPETLRTRENLTSTQAIIKTSDGWDLQEIGYLSLFCNPIIGRSSGPYCFALTRPNSINEKKAFICFSYFPHASHYATGIKISAKKYWSGAVNPMEVYDTINKVLIGGDK